MSGLFSALAGWAFFGAVVLMVGTVVARWRIIPAVHQAEVGHRDWLIRNTSRIGFGTATVLPALVVLLLIRQLMEFRDPFAPLTDDLALLLRTSWGTSWKLGMAAASVCFAGMFWAKRGKEFGWWLASAGALVLAAYPAATGHAAAVEGPLRLLSISGDLFHVLAAGAWLGGLAVILELERRWRRTPEAGEAGSLLPVLVPTFSPVAVGSVGILILTGLFASWLHLPAPASLVTTNYGRILLLKVFLVMLVLGLGGWNWKRLSPGLSSPDGPQSMRRVASLELALGTLVLLLTAILIRTSPLGH
jgi:putative copper export protein